MEYFWLLLFIVFLAGILFLYSKKGIKYSIGFTYIVSIIVSARLFYEYQGTASILNCLVFSAQMFTFGVNGKELVEIIYEISSKISYFYIICVWAVYLVSPALTVSAVLSFIKKGLDRLTLKMIFKKDIYIISEKNENSLLLASDIIKTKKNSVVIFAGTDSEDISSHKICVNKSELEILKLLNKNNSVHICFNDTDSGILLDKVKNFLQEGIAKKVKIYVFSDNEIVFEVVDGINKTLENLYIKIISVNAILMKSILWDYPLYKNMNKNDELNVSVFGVGEFGGYFAKNTLWCGVLPSCRLKLNLIDRDNYEEIIGRVSDNIPKEFFDIEVFSENIHASDLNEKLEKTRVVNSDYILVAMGNDDLNIKVSRKLRLYFSRNGRNPFILTVLKNQSKFTVMKDVLKCEGIEVTGGVNNIYGYKYIFEDRFFNKAYKTYDFICKNYNEVATVDGFYKQSQIDILSSYASAIHNKYKVFALTGKENPTAREINSKLVENHSSLVEAEHQRWVNFEVLKGYIGVPQDKLYDFLINNNTSRKRHRNDELKIHACITDVDGVKRLDNMLYEHFGKKPNLIKNDKDIIDNLYYLYGE